MNVPTPPTPPQVYADAFYVKWSDYGVDLTFGRGWNSETSALDEARVTVVIGDKLGKELMDMLIRISAERAKIGATQDEPRKTLSFGFGAAG